MILYEDVLSSSWNRYYYDIEANSEEEAVERIKDGEDCYDVEQIFETIQELDPSDNNGEATREIYRNGRLLWDNTKLVNKNDAITNNLENISKNLSLIMEGEPESFIGGDIAFSTVVKVMESLGWKFCEWDGLETNGWDIDYWFYFIKDEKNFSYKVSGNVYFGGVKIEKCEKHYER